MDKGAGSDCGDYEVWYSGVFKVWLAAKRNGFTASKVLDREFRSRDEAKAACQRHWESVGCKENAPGAK